MLCLVMGRDDSGQVVEREGSALSFGPTRNGPVTNLVVAHDDVKGCDSSGRSTLVCPLFVTAHTSVPSVRSDASRFYQ